VLLIQVAVYVGIPTGYVLLTGRGGAKAPPFTFTEKIGLVSVINVALLAIVPALVRATSGARAADLGLRAGSLGAEVRLGALAFLLFCPVVYAINFAASLIWKPLKHPLEEMVRNEFTPAVVPLAIVSAVVLAPAAEELIFRVIIQGWLTQAFRKARGKPAPPGGPDLLETLAECPATPRLEGWIESETTVNVPLDRPDPAAGTEPCAGVAPGRGHRWEDLKPIVYVSAFFAIVHLPQWPAPIAIFLLSIGLGLVYQRSGSLVASFVMHAMFNGLGTLVLLWSLALGARDDVKPDPHPADPKPGPAVPARQNRVFRTGHQVQPVGLIEESPESRYF
jgi:membrane protease YdiL (CAAX protease family)